MNKRLFFGVLLVIYVLLIIPFVNLQKNRPIEVKLGYLPHAQVLKVISGEHRSSVAGMLVMRVLFYFGSILQKFQDNVIVSPEFLNMYRTIRSIVALDPYNMDSYYFAQSVFTWDLGRVQEVNALLEQGAKYRTWDPYIPFYLGFNYSYFLKDYTKAAEYMQSAAELSGNPLYAQLAARYFYESEQAALGLAFLETMINNARDKTVRRNYELRRDALLATLAIERARDAYRERYGAMPIDLEQLLNFGLLSAAPDDPYGGSFYLDERGRVRTTSELIQHESMSDENGNAYGD
ncbi:hypothetical protein P9J64_14365 [Deltaproteobacteria bacterium IMCC39524]|nr:hypothetical protein [Deltaproteobacteria bacterium IMCC39524]